MNDINFDLLLNEKFFDYYSGKVYGGSVRQFYLYINPDLNEIERYICRGSRGMAMSNGDLYMEGYEGRHANSTIIHQDIIDDLHRKGIVSPSYSKEWDQPMGRTAEAIFNIGIPVQRDGDCLAISESIHNWDKKAVDSIFKMGKVKNPYWTFINTNIYEL